LKISSSIDIQLLHETHASKSLRRSPTSDHRTTCVSVTFYVLIHFQLLRHSTTLSTQSLLCMSQYHITPSRSLFSSAHKPISYASRAHCSRTFDIVFVLPTELSISAGWLRLTLDWKRTDSHFHLRACDTHAHVQPALY
jgi:hypothetical protein